MTEPKREKIIKVRVSPEELATLQMHCTRGELARWIGAPSARRWGPSSASWPR